MSDSFTKLFSSIVHSTIWQEPNHVRLVWITMLAMAGRDGIVRASIPGLGVAARVTLQEAEDAIRVLSSPDKYSSTKAHEGRRIAEVQGGWSLLNYFLYRQKLNAEDRRESEAKRKQSQRDAKRIAASVPVVSANVPQCPQSPHIAEAEAEAEREEEICPPEGGRVSDAAVARGKMVRQVFDFWRKEHDHGKARLDNKRRSRIAARLREGFTVQELCIAIRAAKQDRFLMGENDTGTVYDELISLLRDAPKVEKLLGIVGGRNKVAQSTQNNGLGEDWQWDIEKFFAKTRGESV